MIYLFVFVGLFFIHLILKLNVPVTIVLGVYFLVTVRFHLRRYRKQKEEQQRFTDAAVYMDTLLYAFVKEGKIDGAVSDVWQSLPDGKMKQTVGKALAHMRMTFDESQVMQDALGLIQQQYNCKRIANIHEFMLHVEVYGGDIERPVNLLLADKNHWEARTKEAMQERKKMFRDIVLSIVTSLGICGMVLYLPVMNVDISANLLTQILTAVVVVLDDLLLFKAQSFLAVDWLRMDLAEQEENDLRKMEDFMNYEEGKEKRLSFLLAAAFLALTVFLFGMGNMWGGGIGMLLTLVGMNQHRIGHALAKKNLRQRIACAFPNWLMDLVLLLQSENVHVALSKSQNHVPPILRKELGTLIARLEMEPEEAGPFHDFLKDFEMPEVSSAMSMLYSLSSGNSGNADRQVNELIVRNQQLLELAETERMKSRNSGMYLLFLAPVLTASVKLVADMAVFMLTFLATPMLGI